MLATPKPIMPAAMDTAATPAPDHPLGDGVVLGPGPELDFASAWPSVEEKWRREHL